MPAITRLVRSILIIALLLCLVVLFDVLPLVRGPKEWRWTLLNWPQIGPLLFNIIASFGLVVGWWLINRRLPAEPGRSQAWLARTVLVVLALLLQISFLTLYRSNPSAILYERLASNQASGYFTVAQEIDHLPTFLADYSELMPTFGPDPHPRSKPPGIVLAYWGLIRLMEQLPGLSGPLGHWARGVRCADPWLVVQPDAALAANALMGWLTILLSSLVVWPAYGLASRRWGSAAGWLAGGLVALLPGRLLFAPHMDTVYPFLTLLALYLADAGLRRKQPGWTFAAGFVLSIATFMSLVNGLVTAVAGLFVLFHFWPPAGIPWRQWWRTSWRPVLVHVLSLVAGTLTLWALYRLVSGVTPWAIYEAAAPARHDLNRSYWLWLVGNVYDFALFAGLPAFVLALPWLQEWRRLGQSPDLRTYLRPILASFWVVFLALVLSGAIRGEVGRIWLMLAPLPAVLAARWPARVPAEIGENDYVRRMRAGRLSLAIILATALLSWAMGLRWEVTRLEWPPPAERSVNTTPPNDMVPLAASFGPDIRLAGYRLEQDEDLLQLTLIWQAAAQPDVAWTVFIHLTGPDGSIVAQRDVMPQDGLFPSTCWLAGEVVTDLHGLDLTGVPGGTYGLVVGLYRQGDNLRPGEPVDLGPITVAP
jgi:hypothetical protein